MCWNREEQNFRKTSETIGIRSRGENAREKKTRIRTEESILCVCTVQYDSYQPIWLLTLKSISWVTLTPFSSDTQGLSCYAGMIQATTDSCMDSTNSSSLYLCSCYYLTVSLLKKNPTTTTTTKQQPQYDPLKPNQTIVSQSGKEPVSRRAWDLSKAEHR